MQITDEIKSGATYTFFFKYLSVFIQILTTSVMARLLTPSEFGIYVAVFVIIYFFQLLSDSGIAASIIQRKDLTESEIFSLFLISLLIGLVLSVSFLTLSPLIAAFYKNNVYYKITPLLTIALFFYTAHLIPWALLYRKKKFKTIGIVQTIVQIVPAILGIYLAFNNFSYYSLVYQSIFQSILKFILVLYLSPVIVSKLDFRIVKKIFRYSLFKSMYDIINYIARNLDNLLIGKFLGMNPLGFYDKAYKLMLLPINSLADVVSQVLHPILSEHQTDHTLLNDVYIKLIKYFSLLGISLSIYLFFSAKEIIFIIFGNQWSNSIIPFKYLALTIWIQMILSPSQPLLLSMGKSNYLFILGLVSSLLMAIGILLGTFIFKSINSIALLILISNIIFFFFATYLLSYITFKNKILTFLSSLKSGIIIGSVIFTANVIIYNFFNTGIIIIDFGLKLIVTLLFFLFTIYKLEEHKALLNFLKKKSINTY